MSEVIKSVLVPYSAQQMYGLVADVQAYPAFLPWCGGGYCTGKVACCTVLVLYRRVAAVWGQVRFGHGKVTWGAGTVNYGGGRVQCSEGYARSRVEQSGAGIV